MAYTLLLDLFVHETPVFHGSMIVLASGARPERVHDAGGLCSPSTLPAGQSTFAEMYASDGNHPSNAGTYLEGLIIASSITGEIHTIAHRGTLGNPFTMIPADLRSKSWRLHVQ